MVVVVVGTPGSSVGLGLPPLFLGEVCLGLAQLVIGRRLQAIPASRTCTRCEGARTLGARAHAAYQFLPYLALDPTSPLAFACPPTANAHRPPFCLVRHDDA